MFVILLIITIQSIAIYFDNQAYLLLLDQKKGTAERYAKKGIYQLYTRLFLFLIPPFLGYLSINKKVSFILFCLVLSSLISLLITIFQYKKLDLIKIQVYDCFKISSKKTIILIVGVVAMIFHLFIPFYLNITAYYSPKNALWIVQLTPILSAISTFYITFYFDPALANFIDRNHKKTIIINEFFIVRILGRSLVFLSSCLIFYNL